MFSINFLVVLVGTVAVAIAMPEGAKKESIIIPNDAVATDDSGNEISWPMFDMESEEMLMAHGLHCIEMVETCTNNSDSNTQNESLMVHKMHCTHCQRLIRRVKRFYEAHPQFSVSPDLCSVVTGTRVRRAAIDYSYSIKIEIRFRKRRSVSSDPETQFPNLKSLHFAELLMKDWKGDELSKLEAEYMRKVEGEESVLAAARSLTCQKGPLAQVEVNQMITQLYAVCW